MKGNFPIVGIGASAGGLEPLELFFETLGSQSGCAYVIIQHLAPNHKSLMDELLSRYTHFPIDVITDGAEIKPDHIYLNPPKKFVEIIGGKFSLLEKEDRRLSFPISSFFRSLASYRREKAAGIVLSGTGSDGSEGIKYIKEEGGLVMAQHPETAKFDGMPKNAIHTGSVDKICEVTQMPREIERFFKNPLYQEKPKSDQEMQTEKIASILEVIEKDTGVSFADYKISTIYRRTVRRLGILGMSDLDEYYTFLKTNQTESHHLASELLIGVTRFFRDEDAFEELKNKVIPQIVEANEETKSIRVWVTACSTGEEAYSIAILLNDYLRANNLHYDVVIFATDLDKDAIKLAGSRVFPESIAAEIPYEYLRSYFTAQKKGYTVIKEIREMIVFSVHNLIQDPPFGKVDLLSCRNFLIYLNNAVQSKLFSLFQFALKQNGFLFLGSSESLGQAEEKFREVSNKYKIYQNIHNRKQTPGIRLGKKPSYKRQEGKSAAVSPVDKEPKSSSKRMLQDVQEAVIQEFVSDTIVFTENFELVHTTGQVSRWLKFPRGLITTNILKMLPSQLSLSLEVLTNKVLDSGEPALLRNVPLEKELKEFNTNGREGFLEVEIRRLNSDYYEKLLAAVFRIRENKHKPKTTSQFEVNLKQASKEKITLLERELRANQEDLQTTIEELESSNEELQAANEELQSSNEELESVNEELYTVNAEFQEKVEELSVANNDLNNLIQSTDIALLFLDRNLMIRKFTPAITNILSLSTQDVGRHISNFRAKVLLDDFVQKVEQVYEKLIPYEATVEDTFNQTYILKITPFFTSQKKVQGVVITFVDITAVYQAKEQVAISNQALENAQEKYQEQRSLFELIVKNSSDIICIHDFNGKIEYVSPSVHELTGLIQDKIMYKGLTDYMVVEKDVKTWNSVMDAFRHGKHADLISYRFRTQDGRIKWFETNFRAVTSQTGNTVKIISNTRDITGRMRMQKELSQLNQIINQTKINLVVTDIEGKMTYVNESFLKLTGYSESELLGRKPGDLLQGPETSKDTIKAMRKAIQNQEGFQTDIINYTRQSEKYWIYIHCEPLFDIEGEEKELVGFFALQEENTLKVDYKSQIQKLNEILREQNLKLKDANNRLDEFAYIVSHDLKSPLRNIASMVSLIEKNRGKVEPEKEEKFFNLLLGGVSEMSRLIDSLLEYSRTGRLDESLTEVQVTELEAHLKQLFSSEIKELGGEINFDIPMDKVMVYQILFKRLLTNLISNAIKYRSEKPPVIEISCEEKDEFFLFAVRDNGIGIPDNQFENIFKVLHSLKPGKDNNGIGLAVCQTIIQFHEGRIWVESEVGKGSTFYFTVKKF